MLIYFTFQSAAPPFYSLVLLEVVICIFSSAFCYSYGPLAWLIPTGKSLLTPFFPPTKPDQDWPTISPPEIFPALATWLRPVTTRS